MNALNSARAARKDTRTNMAQSDEAKSPFVCASAESVTSLLRLCFERSELIELLGGLIPDVELYALHIGAQYRLLAQLAREDAGAGRALDEALQCRLSDAGQPTHPCPMFELASAWTRARESNSGLAAAALLWLVARSPAPCFRKLEAVMVEDIHYLAARSFATQPTRRGMGQ